MSQLTLNADVCLNAVWDVNTLEWAPMSQPILNAGSVTIPGTVDTADRSGRLLGHVTIDSAPTVGLPLTNVNFGSGTVSSAGNNLLLTPDSGKLLRLFYCSYNPVGAVTAAFRFGAGGNLFLLNTLPGAAIVSKEFGDIRCVQGAVDEPLYLNLSLGISTNWNIFFTEV